MRGITWHPDAWVEYLALQEDRKMLKRVNLLLKDIQRNGFQSTLGKAELLKGDFSGYASVRIDWKNRIIFTVTEENVQIVKCGGHYYDS